MPDTEKINTQTFNNLGISQKFVDYLNKHNFIKPTPIQQNSIPAAIKGKDLIGIAQTGTGKTLAFGVPMVQLISENQKRGLIVVPTRELALQANELLHLIGRPFGLKTAVVIGGESTNKQKVDLRNNPHIIIATPGRLLDHIQQKSVKLSNVGILVLDEADRMFDMGFAPQIKNILKHIPEDRQTMLFSATMPSEIVNIVVKYMSLPVRIEVAPQGSLAENITQELFVIRKEDKKDLLIELLNEYTGTVLIFSRTKHQAKALTRYLIKCGVRAAEIHSNRTLAQRRTALDGFKSGRFRALVATDVASRGIDVDDIELIINYDLPDETENYVHRIGRTARAGKKGHAISFATPDQGNNIRKIENLIRFEIQVSQHPNIISQEFDYILSKPKQWSFKARRNTRNSRWR